MIQKKSLFQFFFNLFKVPQKVNLFMKIAFVDEVSDAGTGIVRKISDDDEMKSVVSDFLDDITSNSVLQIKKIWSDMMLLDDDGRISFIRE